MLLGLLWIAAPAVWADGKYTVKAAMTPPPQEVNEPIRKLLNEQSLQVLNDKGTVICEIWFRKSVPVKATPEQIKNGLTYREVEESTVFGAIRFDQPSTDYRKQKVKPGAYTLRLGYQPMDGDHMGTAPYPDFLLLLPAKLDQKPDLMETKELREMSAKAIGMSHPGVMELYPNEKPEDQPQVVDKGNNTWVLFLTEPVSVDNQKAAKGLGLGLVVVGHTTAE